MVHIITPNWDRMHPSSTDNACLIEFTYISPILRSIAAKTVQRHSLSPATSDSLDGAGPNPDLMEVAGDPEPHTDGPLRPRHRDTIDELLDPVLPDDPHADLLRSCGGRHREVAKLLRLQAPGLTLGKATLVDHEQSVWIICPSDSKPQAQHSSRPRGHMADLSWLS